MTIENLLQSLETEVKRRFEKQHADHDFDHILRVTRTALLIQEAEGGDRNVVKALALLHDISDHKLNGGIYNDGERVGREVMNAIGFSEEFIETVAPLIDKISFKGSGVADETGVIELQIVRDADRLDAIGAIGIARAFHFGGARNRKLFQSDLQPKTHTSFEDYSNDQSHTINHFYEKLLLLKARMQTETGKQLASERHILMEKFLEAFKNEWFATNTVNY